MRKGHLRRFNKPVSIWLICFAMMASTIAQADFAEDVELLANAEEINDSELSKLRGRFVAGNKIAYFGVEMITSWKTGAGEVITTGLTLGIEPSAHSSGSARTDFRPTISFYATSNYSELNRSEDTEGITHNPGGGGLEHVAGVVQSIQLAGDMNNIDNDFRLLITEGNSSGHDELSASADALSVELGGTTHYVSDSGNIVSSILSNNSIGIAVFVPGQGVSIQKISGGGIKNLMQSVSLGGSQNSIYNITSLNLRLGPTIPGNLGNISNALQQLRGL